MMKREEKIEALEKNLQDCKDFIKKISDEHGNIEENIKNAHERFFKFLLKNSMFDEKNKKEHPYVVDDAELTFWRMMKDLLNHKIN